MRNKTTIAFFAVILCCSNVLAQPPSKTEEMLEEARRQHVANGGNANEVRLAEPDELALYHQRKMIQQKFPNVWVVGDFVLPNGGGGSLSAMSELKTFSDKLELTEDQEKELLEIKSAFSKRLTEFTTKRNKVLNSNSQKDLEKFNEIYSEFESQILDEVLMPFQKNQLAGQVSRKVGVARFLISPFFKATFNTDAKQDESIRETSKQIADTLESETAKLKAKCKKQLLAPLTASQRQQLDETGVDVDAFFESVSVEELLRELRMAADDNHLGFQKLKSFWEEHQSIEKEKGK